MEVCVGRGGLAVEQGCGEVDLVRAESGTRAQ